MPADDKTELTPMPQVLSRNNVEDYLSFDEYRKLTTTRITSEPIKLAVEVKVMTAGDVPAILPAGWEGHIALDSDGTPYPLDQDTFHNTYTEV